MLDRDAKGASARWRKDRLPNKEKEEVVQSGRRNPSTCGVNRSNRRGDGDHRNRGAISAGDVTAGNLLNPTLSAIDQAITKNVLHENTANRYKPPDAGVHGLPPGG
jgi:hypothetical protein